MVLIRMLEERLPHLRFDETLVGKLPHELRRMLPERNDGHTSSFEW